MMKLLAALMAMLLIAGCLAACDSASDSETTQPSSTAPTNPSEPEPSQPVDDGKSEYKILLKDSQGNPVTGVMVQICKEGSTCFTPVKTDADGVAVYKLEAAADYYGTVSKDQTIKEYFSDGFEVTLVYDPPVA